MNELFIIWNSLIADAWGLLHYDIQHVMIFSVVAFLVGFIVGRVVR